MTSSIGRMTVMKVPSDGTSRTTVTAPLSLAISSNTEISVAYSTSLSPSLRVTVAYPVALSRFGVISTCVILFSLRSCAYFSIV